PRPLATPSRSTLARPSAPRTMRTNSLLARTRRHPTQVLSGSRVRRATILLTSGRCLGPGVCRNLRCGSGLGGCRLLLRRDGSLLGGCRLLLRRDGSLFGGCRLLLRLLLRSGWRPARLLLRELRLALDVDAPPRQAR